MNEAPSSSPEVQIIAALRGAGGPLTLDQLVEQMPTAVSARARNPRQWLRNHVLGRPEVAHAARGVYTYLPDRITGSTLRLPLLGREARDARLWAPPELAYALWFRSADWHWHNIERGVTATCELPDGRRSSLTYVGPMCWVAAVAPGEELRQWLQHERGAVGDSLLFQVTDGEAGLCRVTLERRAGRDASRVGARNRLLADTVAAVLREARRPLGPMGLALWLLARDVYQYACPSDPLEVVLTLCDDRFTENDDGEMALATAWDRLQARDEDLQPLNPLTASLPSRLHSSYDLGPWLEAVGYVAQEALSSSERTAVVQIAAWAGQVYRLRVALKERKILWRTIEIRSDQTLGELDRRLRRAFQHETSDHFSEFFIHAGGGRGMKGLGEIYYTGLGAGAELRLGELELSRGDALGYLYDFGERIQHTIKVEAIVPAEPKAKYPREVARNAPEYRECVACAARGKTERATWSCVECSHKRHEDVIVCESCLRDQHHTHYADEILY
jgi:hypothetical protein